MTLAKKEDLIMAKGDRYSDMGDLTALGFLVNALGGGGDAGQTFPHSDAEELSRGCRFIPGEVTMARRRGERVEFHNNCSNSCCWYWQMPDGSRIYHWSEADYMEIARANDKVAADGQCPEDSGPCPNCGNTHTTGGTINAS